MSNLASYLQRRFDTERAAIATELHDILGGLLISAKIDIGLLEKALTDNPPTARAQLTKLKASLDAALALERQLVERLYPTLLVHVGLYASLRWTVEEACRRTGRASMVDIPTEELQIPPDTAIGLYRVAQDALTDVLAATSRGPIELKVRVRDQILTMRVASTGDRAGDNSNRATAELALLDMQHRAESIGGLLKRDIHPSAGVAVTVELELAAQQ